MIDNIDIAVLTKVNELAERYGIKPSDFVSTVRQIPQQSNMLLAFEVPATGSTHREKQFTKMVTSIGVNAAGTLEGTASQLIDVLDAALKVAPKRRTRF